MSVNSSFKAITALIICFLFFVCSVSPWDSKVLGPEPRITAAGQQISRPDYLRQPSERRDRIKTRPPKVKKLKREFGKGLVGNLLNRTFNRNRINSKVREQMEDIEDHR